MAQIYPGLSGDGVVVLGAVNTDGVVRVDVTDLGTAPYFDGLRLIPRYRAIGFISFIETNPYVGDLTAAYYLSDPIWIGWRHFSQQFAHPAAVGGIDSFYYSFRSGVTATVAIGY